MAVSAEFKKALEASKNARARWKEAKKEKPGEGGFSLPDLPRDSRGPYMVRVTASGEKTDKGDVRAKLRVAIVDGDHRGKSWNVDCTLISTHANEKTRAQIEEIGWSQLSRALQVLCDVDEDEFGSWEIPRIFEELDLIDEEAPYAEVGVSFKNKERVDPKTKKKEMREYFNTYFNKLLTDDQIDAIEEKYGDGADTDGDADDGSEVEDGSELEGDEDGSELEGEEGDGEADEDQGEVDSSPEESNGASSRRGSSRSSSRSRGSARATSSTNGSAGKSGGRSSRAKPVEQEPEAAEVEVAEPGDFVFFKPKGKRNSIEFLVKAVSKRNKTYSLVENDENGEEVKGGLKESAAPWDKCEIVSA